MLQVIFFQTRIHKYSIFENDTFRLADLVGKVERKTCRSIRVKGKGYFVGADCPEDEEDGEVEDGGEDTDDLLLDSEDEYLDTKIAALDQDLQEVN